MAKAPLIRITDKLAESINKLYKTGGFALAFGFAGIILMLSASLVKQELSMYNFIIGSILTFACFGFFLYTTLISNYKARKSLIDNKEIIDTIQDISLELIKMINVIQSYSFKNIEKINHALNSITPILSSFPFLGDKLNHLGLSNINSISNTIVNNTEKIERVISELEVALLTADCKKLNHYLKDLSTIVNLLKDSLRK